ncbi:MAG: FAD-binding protein [Nitrospirota bacterium]|nr:MAG: FAD-binding protein [Nitrospirota bacterium]
MTKTKKEIWVYGDLRNEKFFGFSLNVLAKARELSLSIGGMVAVVLLGPPPKAGEMPETEGTLSIDAASEACINHGAGLVYILEHESLAMPRTDLYATSLASALRKQRPLLVLFPVTDFGRELAARAARINNTGLIAECIDLWFAEERVVAKCPSWGGEVLANITFSDGVETGLATVLPHAFKAIEYRGEPGITELLPLESLEVPKGPVLLSHSVDEDNAQKLEESNVVVVGGAGLNNPDDFGLVRELSNALGAEVGATRPPVLQHWVEEDRLIGQTGKNVSPNLLFSIGTSGAIQYTAGIMDTKTIVAINRDPNAPIFQVADLGVVADAKTFLPLLSEKVRQALMRNLADALKETEKSNRVTGFGVKVKKLRESHDFTVEALAEATGQSPDFIEKVERDEITPPVSFLLRFAGALQVNPGTFLRREEKTMIRNQRAREFMKRTQNYSYQTLSPGAESDHLRAFMITIEPKQTHKPVAYKHDGEEFIFVMEGGLRLTLGNKAHHLKPGESIHFNSDTPHKLKSTSNEMTRCLVVLYTP